MDSLPNGSSRPPTESPPRGSGSSDDVNEVKLKAEPDEHRESSFAISSSSPRHSPPTSAQAQSLSRTASAYSRPAPPTARSGEGSGPGTLPRRELLPDTDKGLTSTQDPSRAERPKLTGKVSVSQLSKTPFERFDVKGEVEDPVNEDVEEQKEFQKDISQRFLILLLETRAWCDSRPRLERVSEIKKLETGIQSMAQIEEQQGRSSSSDYGCSSAASVALLVNYEPMREAVTTQLMEHARQKLTQFVRHFTQAIQALTYL